MTEAQAATTRFCARIIGPLLLIIGAVVLTRFDALALIVPAILQDSALTFITGLFTLIVGMVLFVAHHHWSGATAIVISILGLATIVRGVLLMLVPELAASIATQALSAGIAPWVAGGITILIGLWLTYVGWFAKQIA
jgi:hypothetical protein